MRQNLAVAALLAGLAAWPAAAIAQESPDASPSGVQLSEADAHFAEQSAAGGKAEVDLGNLAVEKAESAEVKQFGQMMVDDHGKANEELAAIVEQKDAAAASDIPPEAKQAQEELAALSGAEFDRAYIDQMVTDHEKTVELFQTEVQSGEDAELKQFAEKTLPTIQTHLEHAQQLQTQMSEVAGAADTAEPAADLESIAPAAGTTQQAAIPANPLGGMTADELIGKNVTNDTGDEVGEIQDIVINGEDKAVLAVISVGGFLGIGDKNVAVPFAELQQGEDESVILSGATEEQLAQMPAYDEATGYEAYPRDQQLNPDAAPN